MKILDADEITAVLEGMAATPIFAAVITFMATGLRRGEVMGLQWGDVNLDTGRLEVRRAVEKTKAHGLQLKPPKTKRGRRGITLPAYAVEVLKQHRTKQLETRLALGIGKLPAEAFVFGSVDGSMRDPDRMTQDWKRFTAARKLPKVTLQGATAHPRLSLARFRDRRGEGLPPARPREPEGDAPSLCAPVQRRRHGRRCRCRADHPESVARNEL
jgi:integrase